MDWMKQCSLKPVLELVFMVDLMEVLQAASLHLIFQVLPLLDLDLEEPCKMEFFHISIYMKIILEKTVME